MATKSNTAPAKTTTTTEEAKDSLLRRGGIAALKATASTAMGASIAAAEVELGETAGKAVNVGFIGLGMASQVLLDEEEHKDLREIGKSALDVGTGVAGYKYTHKNMKANKEARQERAHDKAIATLQADMEHPDAKELEAQKRRDALSAPKENVPVKKQRVKAHETGEHNSLTTEG